MKKDCKNLHTDNLLSCDPPVLRPLLAAVRVTSAWLEPLRFKVRRTKKWTRPSDMNLQLFVFFHLAVLLILNEVLAVVL